ncbi:MAG TPA: FxsA family protein, partial [Thermoleophilaceae bacterium]
MPLFKLLVVFIVVPLAELYVIYKIGDAIGILPTIALLALDSVAGSLLLKSQGRAVWTKFRQALEQGRIPQREVLDGVLVIFGGAFLITPGFLTDII